MEHITSPPRLCFKLGKALRSLAAHYERSLQPFGLTPARAFVLETLCHHGPMRFKELAEAVSLEGPTLTGILDRLERDGWVRRQPHSGDRRSLIVSLTDKAVRLVPGILRAETQADSELTDYFAPPELETFLRVLDAIPERLHELVTS